MNIKLKAAWVGMSLALTASLITPAMADEWDKKTEFQFSSPVEVPGRVLDAGKYVFQLLDSQSDRNIVQIFSVDPEGNQRLVTTIMAVPAYVVNVPDKPTIRFEERRGDSPEAIRSWFHPGDKLQPILKNLPDAYTVVLVAVLTAVVVVIGVLYKRYCGAESWIPPWIIVAAGLILGSVVAPVPLVKG